MVRKSRPALVLPHYNRAHFTPGQDVAKPILCETKQNYHSDEDVFRALEANAKAYLLKTADLEQIVSAIRSVYSGKQCIPSHIAGQLARRISREQLSVRELEILQLMATGKKNHEIGKELFINPNTIRNHVIHVME